MNIYCTLFNQNYLDKALVMMRSLEKADENAQIYVLCMDETSYSVLQRIRMERVILISFADFCDDSLKAVMADRSRAELCWTCTSRLIHYVLHTYHEKICTYVDADLCFYSNPHVLVQEMLASKCSVQVVSHRFTSDEEGREQERKYGKNCVQFNTFTDTEESLQLLDRWIKECENSCSAETVGDQKYTDQWGEYPYVSVSNNIGAGVAPWNVHRYQMVRSNPYYVYDRFDKMKAPLIFYHFAQINYTDRYHVRILPPKQHWVVDEKLIRTLYLDYLNRAEAAKEELDQNYHVLPMTQTGGNYAPKAPAGRSRRLRHRRMADYLDAFKYHTLGYLRKKTCLLSIERAADRGKIHDK